MTSPEKSNIASTAMKTCFCLSVPGGWQTMLSLTGEPIGPVFNKIQDLWAWQRDNLTNGASHETNVL
jgi:hypothetical protein